MCLVNLEMAFDHVVMWWGSVMLWGTTVQLNSSSSGSIWSTTRWGTYSKYHSCVALCSISLSPSDLGLGLKLGVGVRTGVEIGGLMLNLSLEGKGNIGRFKVSDTFWVWDQSWYYRPKYIPIRTIPRVKEAQVRLFTRYILAEAKIYPIYITYYLWPRPLYTPSGQIIPP